MLFELRLLLFLYFHVGLLAQQVFKNFPPKFVLNGESEILLQLREGPDTPVGSVIYTLHGEDADDDPLTFGIQGLAAHEMLEIQPTGRDEANIVLKRELDREIKDEYTFVLTLSDGKLGDGNYITQSMIILVLDVNDNEPIFKSYNSSVSVREDALPGILTTLEATDRDEGPFGQVVYELQEPDGFTGKFEIQTIDGKGIISLVGNLDYERDNMYQLQVLAKDHSTFGRRNTGTAALIIKVIDVEDQSPEFIKVPSVTRIPENLPQGSLVLEVKAVDGDHGVNNKISYTLHEAENSKGIFVIHPENGQVFVQGLLDREAIEDYNEAYTLQIQAQEVNSSVYPAPSASIEVTVILTDINDETPTFKSKSYIGEVLENAPISSPVVLTAGLPEVADFDQGKNGTFKLSLEGAQNIFEVTPSEGINEVSFMIRVKNSSLLDYENIKSLNFKIIAKESVADNPKSSSSNITVYIQDANDNSPEFSQKEYVVSVPENISIGTSVAKIQARDPDSGMYGTSGIRYTQITGQMAQSLSLDLVTGIITIKTEKHGFDREQNTLHFVTIEARDSDGTGNRNTVQLLIYVEDANDNVPLFLQSKYETRVYENELDFATPLIVQAHDNDLNGTVNSEIIYSIVNVNPPANFTINSTTGRITLLVPLDFEQIQGSTDVRTLNVTVRATDHGNPPLHSDVPVVVYLLDTNDNGPVFDSPFYGTLIPENAESGITILRVRARDADQSLTFGTVMYRIISGAHDKFIIGAETGEIFVAPGAHLDPDHTSPKTLFYMLEIAALDGGIGADQRQAIVFVNITIADVNNKAPEFVDPEIAYVSEDAKAGEIITQLIAVDLDSTANLHFSMNKILCEAKNEEGAIVKDKEYNFTGAFEVEPTAGLVRLTRSLDREKTEIIKLAMIVQDLEAVTNGQTATATLTVKVEDVNDNSPVFRKQYYKTVVTENSKEGSLITNVVADDKDKNRTVSYSLQGNKNIISLISVNNDTGEITVTRKIDREMFEWLNFTVMATDNGYPPRASFVNVSIHVIDENDNNPVFAPGETNFSIPEDAIPGTKVGMVEAIDADAGDNGKVTYILDKKTSRGKFVIDPDVGMLFVADKLDREKKDSYNLIVEAWDNYHYGINSQESRNAFKQVYVKILDVNDEIPHIVKDKECIIISEYHNIKEAITIVQASDNDDPGLPNSKIVFSLAGNKTDLFGIENIDASSARLFARQSLVQHVSNYTLLVKAEDLGYPPLYSMETMDICITDFNDNAPRFVSPSQNFTVKVPEDTPVGSTVVEVHAVDDDTGNNGFVQYRIKKDAFSHWQNFHIDKHSGLISLKESLDREKQKFYQIRIEAFDLGTPTPLSSDLDLIIYVKNVNDREPYFQVDKVELQFLENIPAGVTRHVLPLTIDDEEYDEDDRKSLVCYFIIGGNDENLFYLDASTHEVSTIEPLDREFKDSYTLIVYASEDCVNPPANPSLSRSMLEVFIRVEDMNDNPPRFLRRVFTGGVTTEAQFGTRVVELKAFDKDDGKNAVLNYYISGPIRQSLAEGLEQIKSRPFLVNKTSGEINLNFDPQLGMKGYFNFDVAVNDTDGLNDSATVYIYLLRSDQRVKFIVRLTPYELRERIDYFRDVLGNITNAIVNVDTYKYHSYPDGSVDKTKSDLYVHFVQRKNNAIMEVPTILKLIDENIELLTTLFQDLNVIDSKPADEARYLLESEDLVRAWLIGLSVFLGALLILVISICMTQRSRYERKLRAATATAFGSQDSGLNRIDVPNTNQHSIEGSNPIWMQSYTNDWYKEDDSVSRKSESNNSLDENALNDQQQQQRQQQQQQNNKVDPQQLQRTLASLKEQNDLNKSYRRNIYESVGKINNMMLTKLETTDL